MTPFKYVTLSCVIAFAMLMLVIFHSRERDYNEFDLCINKGGSSLMRRGGVTCRLPGEKADARTKK